MKALRLTINNIGIIENISIDLNKPLILFYGDLMQGKTTILNAFKWCLGGQYPTDIIKHGKKEASVLFEFSEPEGMGSISRSWYVNKEGVTTARPVSFIRAGKQVSKPDNEIKKFLNPYLLDSDFLKKMGEAERKAYFVSLFGVDTADIDEEISDAAEKAKTLRIEIKSYGEIDTTEVRPIDITAVKSEKERILKHHDEAMAEHDKEVAGIDAKYRKECNDIDAANKEIQKHNNTRERGQNQVADLDLTIKDLEFKLSAAKESKQKICDWLSNNPPKVELGRPGAPVHHKAPTVPDTSFLDEKISEAAAAAVKFEQYQRNIKRANEKAEKEEELSSLENKQRDLRKKKVARLAETSEKSGINGLLFNEDGSFVYDGTTAAMLSTSQIMSLSQELSALYPSGFGLDLIDRAESLGFAIGKNVIEFIEKAKREDKTILAAIVGEKPAKLPDDVGVFVVENGNVA